MFQGQPEARADGGYEGVTALGGNSKLEQEVFMHTTFLAGAVIVGIATIANAAPLMMHREGTVLSVDRMGRSFTTQSSVGSATFKTTNQTVFRRGTTPTNWTAVKSGDQVGITYHLNGRNPVADAVTIGG
jgi:hypothetical protein